MQKKYQNLITVGAGLQESEDVIGQLKKASALFILGSKERFKLTQVATQGIIEGTTNLMQVIIVYSSAYRTYFLTKAYYLHNWTGTLLGQKLSCD